MGRMAHPSEFQGTAVWMASDASSYLTGSDIVSSHPSSAPMVSLADEQVVDGGYTAF